MSLKTNLNGYKIGIYNQWTSLSKIKNITWKRPMSKRLNLLKFKATQFDDKKNEKDSIKSIQIQNIPTKLTKYIKNTIIEENDLIQNEIWNVIKYGTCLGLLSFDIFNNDYSLHILHNLDMSIHGWVSEHLSNSLKQYFDYKFSTLYLDFILIPWITALIAIFILSIKNNKIKDAMIFILKYGLFFNTCVSRPHYDPFAVLVIKHYFKRSRPNGTLVHKSYSFPSGHTTAAVALTGSLLYIFIPILINLSNTKTKEYLNKIKNISNYVFITGYLMTASGRILADAHWFSDTLASYLLASLAVSTFKLLPPFYPSPKNNSSSNST